MAASAASPRRRGRGRSTGISIATRQLQQHDAVGQRHRLGHVVGHQDRGEALVLPDLLDQGLHLDPGQRVERAERLVQRQQPRVADQGAGQRHALLLPAGQHRAIPPRGRPGPPGPAPPRPGLAYRGGRPRAQPDLDIAADALPGQQPRLLEHQPDRVAPASARRRCCRPASARPARRSAAAASILPQPLRPTMATNWPAGMSRSIPCSTRCAPNDLADAAQRDGGTGCAGPRDRRERSSTSGHRVRPPRRPGSRRGTCVPAPAPRCRPACRAPRRPGWKTPRRRPA